MVLIFSQTRTRCVYNLPCEFICRHDLVSWSTKNIASSSVAWPNVIVKRGSSVYGGSEEVCQGGVERHVWQATLQVNVGSVYGSGLDCIRMYFPLAIVRIFMYYVRSCSTTIHERHSYRLFHPALKVHGIIKGYIGIKRLTEALTVPSFVCLFVCTVCPHRQMFQFQFQSDRPTLSLAWGFPCNNCSNWNGLT